MSSKPRPGALAARALVLATLLLALPLSWADHNMGAVGSTSTPTATSAGAA